MEMPSVPSIAPRRGDPRRDPQPSPDVHRPSSEQPARDAGLSLQGGEALPLEDYFRSTGKPYLSEEIGVAPLFNMDDEIRSSVTRLDRVLQRELGQRGWQLDSSAMASLVREMRSRIAGFEHLDSYTKLERLLAVANILESERVLGRSTSAQR